MQGPRITLSKRKTVPATTYNSKVASSYIKKKKKTETGEIHLDSIYYVTHYIKILSFQHVTAIENDWVLLQYVHQMKFLKRDADFAGREHCSSD